MRLKTHLKTYSVMLVLLLGVMCTTAAARIIYVDDDGPADFSNIQAAIADSNDYDTIIVAAGTYDETIDFIGKAITLHSSDGPDVTVIDATGLNDCVVKCISGEGPNTLLDGFTISGGNGTDVEFSPGVFVRGGGGMYISGGSPTVTNCTFAGNGNGIYYGGGMYNANSSGPTVTYCVFSGNTANWGAGMCNRDNSNPTVLNCTFEGNTAVYYSGGMQNLNSSPTLRNCMFVGNDGGDQGGGMRNNDNSNPTVINCMFSGNVVSSAGGGMSSVSGSSPAVTDCTFNGNTGGHYGGGMVIGTDSSPTLTNCTFTGNSVISRGGGIYEAGVATTVTNCVFDRNSATAAVNSQGGGMYAMHDSIVTNCTFTANTADSGGGYYYYNGTLANCVFWGNLDSGGTDESAQIHVSGTPVVNYCCIQGLTGGLGGVGNIDADPCFADVDANDLHLMSQAGRWDPNTESWVQDANTSPCIDAGNPVDPIGLEPFPNGGIVNMGAYGGTEKASKSYFGTPVCEKPIAGDINGDCVVDWRDFAIMAFHWLEDNNP